MSVSSDLLSVSTAFSDLITDFSSAVGLILSADAAAGVSEAGFVWLYHSPALSCA